MLSAKNVRARALFFIRKRSVCFSWRGAPSRFFWELPIFSLARGIVGQYLYFFRARRGLDRIFQRVGRAFVRARNGCNNLDRTARPRVFRAAGQQSVVLIQSPGDIRCDSAIIRAVRAFQKIDAPAKGAVSKHRFSFSVCDVFRFSGFHEKIKYNFVLSLNPHIPAKFGGWCRSPMPRAPLQPPLSCRASLAV